MSAIQPRLRMFAGPNGSGKSTIKEILPAEWLGVYVNADELEKVIRLTGHLELDAFAIHPDAQEFEDFVQTSTLLTKTDLQAEASQLKLVENRIEFGKAEVNSYYASVIADFIRHQLLAQKVTFTFETVMSSPDKVEFLRKAQSAGYRTYLYYVATEDPDINVARVKYRVQTGGHPVAEDKIRSRYERSMALLADAVSATDRAYVFDNSGSERVWIAEVTDGEEIELKSSEMPMWFKAALWDKFDQGEIF